MNAPPAEPASRFWRPAAGDDLLNANDRDLLIRLNAENARSFVRSICSRSRDRGSNLPCPLRAFATVKAKATEPRSIAVDLDPEISARRSGKPPGAFRIVLARSTLNARL